MFAWIAGTVVVVSSLGLAGWSAADVLRRTRGFVRASTLVLLGAGLVSGPLGLAPHLPVRSSTVHYAGPDLLSSEEPVTEVVSVKGGVPGVSRERRVRTTQDGVLLNESTRIEIAVPVGLFIVALGWLALRGRLKQGSGRMGGGPGSSGGTAIALLVALAVAGCSGDTPPAASIAETLLVELLEMRRTGETEGVTGVFHPVATYADHPSQTEYRGVEEIAAFLGDLHSWADGVFLDVVRIHALGDVAVAEWVIEASQARPLRGLMDSVTHRRFRLEGVTLVELEGRLIARAADYADVAPFYLDLGGAITLPGGSVLSAPDSIPD